MTLGKQLVVLFSVFSMVIWEPFGVHAMVKNSPHYKWIFNLISQFCMGKLIKSFIYKSNCILVAANDHDRVWGVCKGICLNLFWNMRLKCLCVIILATIDGIQYETVGTFWHQHYVADLLSKWRSRNTQDTNNADNEVLTNEFSSSFPRSIVRCLW